MTVIEIETETVDEIADETGTEIGIGTETETVIGTATETVPKTEAATGSETETETATGTGRIPTKDPPARRPSDRSSHPLSLTPDQPARAGFALARTRPTPADRPAALPDRALAPPTPGLASRRCYLQPYQPPTYRYHPRPVRPDR